MSLMSCFPINSCGILINLTPRKKKYARKELNYFILLSQKAIRGENCETQNREEKADVHTM